MICKSRLGLIIIFHTHKSKTSSKFQTKELSRFVLGQNDQSVHYSSSVIALTPTSSLKTQTI